MNLRLLTALLVLTGTTALQAQSTPQVKSSAPIKNFRLPSFDKDGHRTTFLSAAEAVIVSNTRIDAKDMNLTLFTSDNSGRIDSVLTSPSATVNTDRQTVGGHESVHFLRDDLEVTGEQWTYFHQEKRVLIENNARVTFRDELKDIIK
ncbi:MAG: hypothetical protein JF599_12065 [Verrucomicrobia bacterium]|nr:hypothetical protein [Verrucomicrobiota bacterium]